MSETSLWSLGLLVSLSLVIFFETIGTIETKGTIAKSVSAVIGDQRVDAIDCCPRLLSVSLGLSRLLCSFVLFYRKNERKNTRDYRIKEFREFKEFRVGMRSLNSLNSLNSLIIPRSLLAPLTPKITK